MPKSKRKRFLHPYLHTDGKEVFTHTISSSGNPLLPVRATRHHLYPRDRSDVKGVDRERFILRLWGYKHFNGWNHLFQFCFTERGIRTCHELTIDEIITLMIIRHPFITNKVGSKPWKILFKEKTLEDATDLLCRMLAWKFNYQWQEIFPKKITLLPVSQAA